MSFAFFAGGGKTPSGGLPPIPTRDELCTVKTHGMQGITVQTSKFGLITCWTDGVITSPDVTHEDRANAYAAKRAIGDTHQMLNVTWNYQANGLIAPFAGRDLSNDLPTLKAYVREALTTGGMKAVLMMLGGDGMSKPQNPDGSYPYNDEKGWTKGFEWLMSAFPGIYAAMGPTTADPDDLRPYILWSPGYDGVVPGWQPPSCVDQWLLFARSVVGPTGGLMLELSAGYCVWAGDEVDNYPTPAGQALDVVMLEMPWRMGPPRPIPANLLDGPNWAATATNEDRAPYDQVWQVISRLVKPYHRPSNQPANDDPGGAPYLLGIGTPRGPFHLWIGEFDTYGVVRGLPQSEVEIDRAYLGALGDGLNVG